MTEAGEENKEQAIGYLFGELDAAERDLFEDRLFDDDEFGLFLSAVEKDLVDEYVRDEMDAALRQRFERLYLKSESRREKVRLANVLQTEVFNETPGAPQIAAPLTDSKPSFWATLADFFRVPNFAVAGGLAVILLFLLVGGWILFRRAPNAPDIVRGNYAIQDTPLPTPQISPANSPVNENSGIKNSNTENTNAAPTNGDRAPAPENKAPEKRPTPAPRPTERREETPQQNRSVFATLFPPLRSGDEKPVLSLPKNAESVRLRVVHDNLKPFDRYRIEIRNRKGEVIFTRETKVNAKNPARPIDLIINAATLGAGTYELRLSGIGADNGSSDIKFYNFSVTKK